jgi:hypothetical protein
MVIYAEANTCRRRILLMHFGDQSPAEAPECCDNCRVQQPALSPDNDVAHLEQPQRVALILLDTIRRLKIKVGREKLAQILKGSQAADILKFHYDRNIYYGRLAVFRQREIEEMLEQLVQLGYLKVIGGKYPVISLTALGEAAIREKSTIPLRLPRQVPGEEVARKRPERERGGKPALTSNPKLSSAQNIQRIVQLGVSKSPEAVPELIAALENNDGNVRRIAASALGKIRDPRAVEPLMSLLMNEKKPQVRQYAVRALGKIGNSRAITMLEKIAFDKSEKDYTRKSATIALRSLMITHEKEQNSLKTTDIAPASLPEDIDSFLSRPHPRPLRGLWQAGWALDFHSRFSGAEWKRSVVGELAYRLKYEGDLSALPPLVEHTLALLAEHPELAQVDAIVPVPPSTPRPVDPVSLFAESLAGRLGLAVLPALVKTRQTELQKEMHSLAQKRANVAGAFAVQGKVSRKRLLVVDDLFDSGATLSEITHQLHRAGAARICVLALTRTIHTDA